MPVSYSQEDLNELVSLAYASALEPSKWDWFMARLSQVAGNINVVLNGHDANADQALGLIQHGFDPAFIESYKSYYSTLNPWAARFHTLPIGVAIASGTVVDPAELKKTEFYTDWIRPQDDIICSGGAILINTADQIVALCSTIREKDRDRLEKPWLELVQFLVPHLQQAFEIRKTIGTISLENRIFREGMEPGLTTVISMDRNRRVQFRNTRAAQMIEDGHILRRSADGKVRFVQPEADLVLAKAILDTSGRGPTVAAPFFASDASGRAYTCRAIPFSETDTATPLPLPFATPETVLLLISSNAPLGSRESRMDRASADG